MRPLQHALILLALLAGVFLLHRSSISSSTALVDEAIYEAAISRAAEGASPYEEGGFFYPPTFARLGVALRSAVGLEGARGVMRAVNLVGLIFLLWFTVVLALGGRGSNPPWLILVLVPLFLTILPGVRLGLSTGNFSFLVGALAVWALWHVDRHPVFAGLLLGSTLLIKPVIAGALPLLVLPTHRPAGVGAGRTATAAVPGLRWTRRLRHSTRLSRSRLVAAAAAVGPASLTLWFDRHELPAMFATELGGVPKGRSLSIYRFARELGLGELRLPLFTLVVALLCIALWGRLRNRRALLVGATLAVPLTTLVVWTHTLVMCLPLAALATARLLKRRRDLGLRFGGADARGRLEAVLVFGGSILLAFAHPGGFGDQPGPVQALLLTPFLAAPIALAAYWYRTEPAGDSAPTDQ